MKMRHEVSFSLFQSVQVGFDEMCDPLQYSPSVASGRSGLLCQDSHTHPENLLSSWKKSAYLISSDANIALYRGVETRF